MEDKLETPETNVPQSQPALDANVDPRTQRAMDHINDSLANLPPLEASLGALSGDLMTMAYDLRGRIQTVMTRDIDGLDDFERMVPVLDAYFKCLKQTERFTELQLRVAAANMAKSAVKEAALEVIQSEEITT